MKATRVLAILTAVLCLAGQSYPQDAVQADVKAIEKMLAENAEAWKLNDAKTILKYDHARFNGYTWEGGLLLEGPFEAASFQEQFEGGMKFMIDGQHHQKVSVFGNTAVVTRYLMITYGAPGSDAMPEYLALRATHVMAKIDGKWSWVHDHLSPLTIPAARGPLDWNAQ